MPYNNTPIAPNTEITGAVSLPLARVKKIISQDEDLGTCSNNAAFAITVATEQFLQYLVEQSLNVVKAERKPRRNIQYKDVANAVARHDNLEFLTDVVPRTTTLKAHKEKQRQAKEAASQANGQLRFPGAASTTTGPTTNGSVPPSIEHPDLMDIDTIANAGAEADADVEDAPQTNGVSRTSTQG